MRSRPSTLSYPELRQGIIDTCLEMNRSGLNQGTSGNVSHRIDGGMLITPTSLPYDQMKPEDIVEMAWDATYEGRHRPSSEWRFHRDILMSRPDVNVVLHTHSIYCTTLAVHERGIPAFHYMVAVAGGTSVRCSPYACFGTQDLSNYALEALKDRLACLLGHHGLIVLGETFSKTLWRAVEMETLAKMYVHAQAMGEPPVLSEAEMAQVIEQIRRQGYGQAPDLDPSDQPRLRGDASAPAKGKAAAKATAKVAAKAPEKVPAKRPAKAPAKTSAKTAAQSAAAPAPVKAGAKTPATRAPATKALAAKAPARRAKKA